MRFATFDHQGLARLGVVMDGQVHDITALYPSMLALIEAGSDGQEAVEAWMQAPGAAPLGLAEVDLRAPIPEPRRDLFAVGLNYLDHFEESTAKVSDELPPYPSFFVKATGSVIGPGESIGYPAGISEQLDYEGEIAVVIGTRGRDIAVSEAEGHVFGYTLVNDVTVRDVQRRHGGQWNKGKSIDRSCPLGPLIVTADEVELSELTIECEVNGELRQHARAGQLIFGVAEIVAELSVGMTLLPGDVILTGTPSGVGYARKPPMFLRPGDQVVVRSNQLGELANPVGTDLGPLVGV